MSLGILSGNDYNNNVNGLAIFKNYKLVKAIAQSGNGLDAAGVVAEYLALDRVVLNNTRLESFSDAIKVFTTMVQTPIEAAGETSLETYTRLRTRYDDLRARFMLRREEARRARMMKRDSMEPWVPRHQPKQKYNIYRTVDAPPSRSPDASINHRPRYTHKLRHLKTKRHQQPDVLLQYKRKPYIPRDQDSFQAPVAIKKSTPPVRPPLTEPVEKGRYLQELGYEHPTVCLPMGTLHANVRRATDNDRLAKETIELIQAAVGQANMIKRRCQALIGRYLEVLFLQEPYDIGSQDRDILDCLCPRWTTKDSAPGQDTQEESDDKTQRFVASFATFLYSDNLPKPQGIGNSVQKFIVRLQSLSMLPTRNTDVTSIKNKT
ncbi:hypothetical protein BGZ94_005697, partial [Podila epigama]